MSEIIATRAPAPKKDQIVGSAKNKSGSASSKSNSIQVSAVTEKALTNKVTEHNDAMNSRDRPSWTRVTLGTLKSVYRRGAGAFSTSHRPGITRNQWAMARVNAFLVLVRTGSPKNSAYVSDNDLLNSGHPMYSEANRTDEVRAEDSFPPSDGMVAEAQKGLDWRAEHNRGGTAVGVARARDIVNRRDLPIRTWRRIKAFFDRHEIDKQGEGFSPGEAGYPSAGRIAWALWGGDAGYSRAKDIVRTANESRSSTMTDTNEERDMMGIYPISSRQMMQADHDEDVVNLFGYYDQTSGADGAHYMSVSAFAERGMVCANCVQYEGPRACHIVTGDIDPGGLCKRWIIPVALISESAPIETPVADPKVAPIMELPVRYDAFPVEARRIGGRDVEFRTVEIGNLEVRAYDDQPTRLSGYAAVFNSPSEPLPFIETIAPGAFTRTLQSGKEVRAFVNHSFDMPLATSRNGSLTLVVDDRGLKVDMALPQTSYGRDIEQLVRAGIVHSYSFGFSVPSGGDTWSADGTTRELREICLYEVSIVTGFSAYPATESAQVRNTEELPAESEADSAATGRPVALAQRYLALKAKSL